MVATKKKLNFYIFFMDQPVLILSLYGSYASADNIQICCDLAMQGILTGSDDSTGIIFADSGNCLRNTEEIAEKKSKNSESIDPLEPPAVLVRSMRDLQSCKNIKDYVYFYIQMEVIFILSFCTKYFLQFK